MKKKGIMDYKYLRAKLRIRIKIVNKKLIIKKIRISRKIKRAMLLLQISSQKIS